jgi:putative ABC transport system permease protein
LRAAWRAIKRSPGVSLAIILVMALGIGANSAIYSLVDSVLFPSIPVAQPESLARVFAVSHRGGDDLWELSLPLYRDYAEQSRAFRRLANYAEGLPCHVSFEGQAAELMRVSVAGGDYFGVLGIQPASGRLISPDDDRPGASPVAVIGYDLWKTRFGASTDLTGKRVKINGTVFSIVGVAPRAFSGLDLGASSSLWVPSSRLVEIYPPARDRLSDRSSANFNVVGRLEPGVTLERAQAELEGIASQLGAGRSVPTPDEAGGTWEEPWPRVLPIHFSSWREPIELSRLLVIAVALVLLTACLNVAGLLVARAERDRRLTALHLALGAPRHRLLRILLLETGIYALFGTAAGLLIALSVARALAYLAPQQLPLPLTGPSVLSPRVLAATIVAALVATLLASLAPLRSVFREDPILILKGLTASGGVVRRRLPLRRLFVVLQVATAAVLLVGAGLFLRTLRHMYAADPGVDLERVVVAIVDPARAGYGKTEGAALGMRILEGVQHLGLTRVAAVSCDLPPHVYFPTNVRIGDDDHAIGLGIVGPGYFDALRIPLLRGRDFGPADRKGAPGVGIVNRSFADTFWPGQDPLGKQLRDVGPAELPLEVVGIAENTRVLGPLDPPEPALYVPFDQFLDVYRWQRRNVFIVSTRVEPRAAVVEVRAAIARIDPTLFVDVKPLRQALFFSFAQARFLALLLSCLGLLVLVIVAAGLSALVSQDTASRVREIAIRAALGARPADLRRLIRYGAVGLVAAGLALGMPGALIFGKLVSAHLFGVSAADLTTLAAVAAGLLAVGVWSARGPLRRALRQSICATLRSD